MSERMRVADTKLTPEEEALSQRVAEALSVARQTLGPEIGVLLLAYSTDTVVVQHSQVNVLEVIRILRGVIGTLEISETPPVGGLAN